MVSGHRWWQQTETLSAAWKWRFTSLGHKGSVERVTYLTTRVSRKPCIVCVVVHTVDTHCCICSLCEGFMCAWGRSDDCRGAHCGMHRGNVEGPVNECNQKLVLALI